MSRAETPRPEQAAERAADDPYRVLGLAPGAAAEEIERAYRRLVRRYPPELAPRRFAAVHRAYRHLTSFESRMRAVRAAPEAALAALYPWPEVTFAPLPPPPGEPSAADLEPLLAPLRRHLLRRLLAGSGP